MLTSVRRSFPGKARRCEGRCILSAGKRLLAQGRPPIPRRPVDSVWPVGAHSTRPGTVVARLAAAGCVAAEEEADELVEAAGGDAELLEELVERRVAGEPLAWVTGWTDFLGYRVVVRPGVYVPRWQTEMLAGRAISVLPDEGLAADLCTGSGAVAVAMGGERPAARVVATDVDALAYRCAQENGVEVYLGHLADPLPEELRGHFDLVFGVVPYVPTDALIYLPRDVRDHEPLIALDGGPGGLTVLDEVVRQASSLLHVGGSLLLELGGHQDEALRHTLEQAGFGQARRHLDDEGDLRGIEVRLIADPEEGAPARPI
jgi:release factor glutamine methyltransferase